MMLWSIATLQALQKRGLKQIAAVTKRVKGYAYYNVQQISDVIAGGGKWIGNPAMRISEKNIDWSITIRKGDVHNADVTSR